ncbi:MAG: hypothetical protein E6940_15495 [Clostridium septicum]|uniref:hypothetical protein n=1 Tax=Clostridium septicum TaxID=1504 RepID=UPI002901263C|nr:hypothetical protein [Clostridium septicum]MDU1315426.1 hypothetical protein [Clostridium septicum]
MKQINFEKISLINDINKYNNEYFKCIDEKNSTSSLNFKSLIFKVMYYEHNFEIRMFIQENDNDINIEVLFENICKNVDVEDSIMDSIILEISKCAKVVENKLKTYDDIKDKLNNFNGKINLDSMFIYKNKHNLITELDSFQDEIKQLYLTLKPNNMEYNNYINELFVFGENGIKTALVLKELGIADFRKTRSGYLINFLDDTSSYSNSFIYNFSKEISNIGIPSMAIPIEILERSW